MGGEEREMTNSKLRLARTARGLSQMRLAKKVGVSQPTICLIERGEDEPDKRLQKRIAKVLSQSVEMLFGAAPDDEGNAQ